jgi:raffinose/stachyose/melibiose transport system substrate-binding protein
MKRIHARRRRATIALLAGLSLIAAACGDDDDDDAAESAPADDTGESAAVEETGAAATSAPASAAAGEQVEIDWWHIQNLDPGLSNWQAMADAYMAEHPNVKINITVYENDAFKAALEPLLQSGDVPDLFQSWGTGDLRELAEAGLVRDITDEVAPWIGNLGAGPVSLYQVDGRQYGVPFNAGIVGFWYNKDLFAQAGIEAPPATWDELLADVQTLKDAGITPMAVGAGVKWPAHFYYAYLMLRIGGAAALEQIAATNDFNQPAVIGAGERIEELLALDPFQPGFLGADWDALDGEAGVMATGQAAMDLMGQWAPGAFRTHGGVETVQDLPWEIGWFPFPAVEGGAGAPTEVIGGGDGFAVGKDAPPEAVEFLEYITNAQNQLTWAEAGSGIPVNPDAATGLGPELVPVAEGLGQSTFLQLYLDQFFPSEVGTAINDQVALLFAGEASPEQAASAITAVAGG